MKHSPLTLAFIREWADLEPLFQHAYFKESLTRIRIAIAAGTFLYAIFGVLDAVMAPDKKEVFWVIRYAIVLPMAAAVFAFSFHRKFERLCNPLLAALCLTAGLGIEAMVILAPPPANYSYYTGIILVFIITHTFFRMGFLWASAHWPGALPMILTISWAPSSGMRNSSNTTLRKRKPKNMPGKCSSQPCGPRI